MTKTLVAFALGFIAGGAMVYTGLYLDTPDHTSVATVRAGKPCTDVGELMAQVNALQDQAKNIPPTVQTTRDDGSVDESPNRLYEQIMLQILSLKAEIDDATVCAGS